MCAGAGDAQAAVLSLTCIWHSKYSFIGHLCHKPGVYTKAQPQRIDFPSFKRIINWWTIYLHRCSTLLSFLDGQKLLVSRCRYIVIACFEVEMTCRTFVGNRNCWRQPVYLKRHSIHKFLTFRPYWVDIGYSNIQN